MSNASLQFEMYVLLYYFFLIFNFFYLIQLKIMHFRVPSEIARRQVLIENLRKVVVSNI